MPFCRANIAVFNDRHAAQLLVPKLRMKDPTP